MFNRIEPVISSEDKLGPCREKTYLQGFRQSEIQTSLLSYRDQLYIERIEISLVASLNIIHSN